MSRDRSERKQTLLAHVLTSFGFSTGMGCAWRPDPPGLAAAIIREALKRGWAPRTSRAPFVIEAGFEMVAGLPEPLRSG